MNEVYLPILLARYRWGWKMYGSGRVMLKKEDAKTWLSRTTGIVKGMGAKECFTVILTIRRDMFEGLEEAALWGKEDE